MLPPGSPLLIFGGTMSSFHLAEEGDPSVQGYFSSPAKFSTFILDKRQGCHALSQFV